MRLCWTLCLAAVLVAAARPALGDVVVQSNATWNGECSLVVDPQDAAHLVVAWMKLTGVGRISIEVSVSTNRGQTWSVPAQLPHHDPLWTSADPTLAFGPDGSVYLAYVDFDARHGTPGGAVLASRSQDGGRIWGPVSIPLTTASTPDRPIDRPWLAVDRTAGTQSGRVYLESKSLVDTTTVRHVWMVSSMDHAATWSAPHQVDAPLSAGLIPAMGVPSVAAEGALWVMYLSHDPVASSSSRFVAASSRDAGVTFQPHILATLLSTSFFPADSLYQFDYHLAAHPQNPELLVAMWTDARLGDADIFTSRTTDGGATWSVPLRLNDDPVGNGVGQDMVWAGFGTNGGYMAGWRDRRLGGAGQSAAFDVYAAYSANAGRTFAPNVRLSAASSPAITMPTAVDFIGVAAGDTLVFAAWTSALSSPYSLHAGAASVAADATDASSNSAAEAPLRVLSTGRSSIRLGLDRPAAPGDRFVVRDVAGRDWATRRLQAAGGPVLNFVKKPPAGVYIVEWWSAQRRAAAKAVLIH